MSQCHNRGTRSSHALGALHWPALPLSCSLNRVAMQAFSSDGVQDVDSMHYSLWSETSPAFQLWATGRMGGRGHLASAVSVAGSDHILDTGSVFLDCLQQLQPSKPAVVALGRHCCRFC
jgi:hypothetical protein